MIWHSWVALFVLIPLALLVAWIFWQKKQRTPTIQFSQVAAFRQVTPSLKTYFLWLPLVLKVLALIFAIIALARPQRVDELVKRNVEGIDIMIVLDISDSMIIEDMPPFKNRMDAAKETIERFIKGRTSDRIGFLVFSGESFTRIPPTLDYETLLKVVQETDSSRNIKMGTALGVALANGVARLKDSTAKNRVMIFLTDGENNSGTIDPETGLDVAKGYGIKIYSIGIGRDGETKIPIITTDPFGNRVKRYQPFYSSVNVDLLQRMANETGGKYYRATDGNKLQEFFSEIDKLERTKIDVNKYTKYAEMFPGYLLIAVILYLLSSLLGRSWLRRTP